MNISFVKEIEIDITSTGFGRKVFSQRFFFWWYEYIYGRYSNVGVGSKL